MLASSPTTSNDHRPHYYYDAHETLEQFRARQQHAFVAGRRAWRERLIRAHLLPFYEALVHYVGQNQYAWVKEQTLADEFAVHVATIKRWLAKLEDAGLIRRQRRFATSSLTYLTAYDADNLTKQSNHSEKAEKSADGPGGVGRNDYRHATNPSVGSKHAPTFGACLPPDHIKNPHLASVGGEIETKAAPELPSSETTKLFEREGVADYLLLPALQQKSLLELQAISGYLDRQRNVYDRPRLFAWLASRDFGAQLLAGRTGRRPTKTAQHQHDAPRDPQEYVSGPLAELIQWRMEEGGTPPRDVPDDVPQPAVPGTLWPNVLAGLRERCPVAEWTTWFKDMTLLELTEDCAVVGAPNVFARDMLRERYLPLIQETLQARAGEIRWVEVVINA